MKAVIGLQLMLIGVCCGLKSSCVAMHDGVKCYGSLGGTLHIQLMADASKIPYFKWTKSRSVLLRWMAKKTVTRIRDSRFNFFPRNGTVRITNLKMDDTGLYKLDLISENGKYNGSKTLQLYVEAPVSSARLVSKCASLGKQRVFCFSEAGDNTWYEWTLDGKPLKGFENMYGDILASTILLKPKTTGRLVCSIRNHISHSFKEMKLTSCVTGGRKKIRLALDETVPKKSL
ncbi:uncharacterized protein LOC122839498 [Gambusia affinis]|uniref:uncharacterized protein LOC122839498 n=1 Tax=Gambusia affinis TaxID=33528 RepID=UPI001CDBA003|nr:uncharacterized protein LOC122839498 [Gambusia affinis]XP_043987041.1 uncharacterized protein LOC122839498 [Gambusia affinis]